MALSGVSITEVAPVAAVSASGAQEVVQIGCCLSPTVGAVIPISSIGQVRSDLVGGELAEAVALRMSYGGTGYAFPVEPSAVGALSAVIKTGLAGSGTVAVAAGPHEPIVAKITTAGTIGTAEVAFSVGGGAYSAPALVASGRVPGTYTWLTFSAGTYVLNSTYTIGVDGTVSAGGGAIETVTVDQVSPVDATSWRVLCTKSGALGTARVKISADRGRSYRREVTTPSGGEYVIPGAGVILTLGSTFGEGDYYDFDSTGPSYDSDERSDAYAAIAADNGQAAQVIHEVRLQDDAETGIDWAETASNLLGGWRTDPGRFAAAALVDVPALGDLLTDASTSAESIATVATIDVPEAPLACAFVGQHWLFSALRPTEQMRRGGSWLAAGLCALLPPAESLAQTSVALPITELGIDGAGAGFTLVERGFNLVRSWSRQPLHTFASTDGVDGAGVRMLTEASHVRLDVRRVLAQVEDAAALLLREWIEKRLATNAATVKDPLVPYAITPSQAGAIERSIAGKMFPLLRLAPTGRARGEESQVQRLTIAVDQSTEFGGPSGTHRLSVTGALDPWRYVGSVAFTVSVAR